MTCSRDRPTFFSKRLTVDFETPVSWAIWVMVRRRPRSLMMRLRISSRGLVAQLVGPG
jgi:hypothetical protein